ncbi:hypothetical protein tb265_39020 [Gemmatimonadetes bacterium T265]|nr:hypothetical protein tb265_39020 [Gemmatimonadetes bacterium T265]
MDTNIVDPVAAPAAPAPAAAAAPAPAIAPEVAAIEQAIETAVAHGAAHVEQQLAQHAPAEVAIGGTVAVEAVAHATERWIHAGVQMAAGAVAHVTLDTAATLVKRGLAKLRAAV